ncbi:hypothetical protein [Enterobacter cloacae]
MAPLKYIIPVIVIVTSGVAGYLGSFSNTSSDGFYCTANVNLHKHNNMLSAVLNYHMEDGQGFLTLNGEYYENGKKTSDVSLAKQFRYSEKDGEYLLSQSPDGILEVAPEDKAVLEHYIPDFYLTNTIPAHHIRIKNIKKGAWIFTTAPVPYFVCTDY